MGLQDELAKRIYGMFYGQGLPSSQAQWDLTRGFSYQPSTYQPSGYQPTDYYTPYISNIEDVTRNAMEQAINIAKQFIPPQVDYVEQKKGDIATGLISALLAGIVGGLVGKKKGLSPTMTSAIAMSGMSKAPATELAMAQQKNLMEAKQRQDLLGQLYKGLMEVATQQPAHAAQVAQSAISAQAQEKTTAMKNRAGMEKAKLKEKGLYERSKMRLESEEKRAKLRRELDWKITQYEAQVQKQLANQRNTQREKESLRDQLAKLEQIRANLLKNPVDANSILPLVNILPEEAMQNVTELIKAGESPEKVKEKVLQHLDNLIKIYSEALAKHGDTAYEQANLFDTIKSFKKKIGD